MQQCCTVLRTALQDKGQGRRLTIWPGTTMMMGGVENGRENKENYLFSNFQRLQENVTQIPIRCVEEQASWKCPEISLNLNFILLSELFHIYISL